MGVFWNHTTLSFHALVLRARLTFIADLFTFHDVFPFTTQSTRGENLDAGVINDGFGTFNFEVGWGLGHSARILAF